MLGTSALAQCFALLCFAAAATLVWIEQRDVLSLSAQAKVITPYRATPGEPPKAQALSNLGDATQDLPIPHDSPELLVSLRDRKVSVYKDGAILQSYDIAVGQEDWPTPTGEFQVQRLQMFPAWQHPITGDIVPPGPDNPLGTRWIGFWAQENWQIGFHGTNQTELIGQAVSHGCIRMRNDDIEALFDLVQVGTVVRIES